MILLIMYEISFCLTDFNLPSLASIEAAAKQQALKSYNQLNVDIRQPCLLEKLSLS